MCKEKIKQYKAKLVEFLQDNCTDIFGLVISILFLPFIATIFQQHIKELLDNWSNVEGELIGYMGRHPMGLVGTFLLIFTLIFSILFLSRINIRNERKQIIREMNNVFNALGNKLDTKFDKLIEVIKDKKNDS